MTRLKLYYEGWLALPEAFRQALGLETNAVLEAELVAGTIVLRPAGEGRGATRPEPEAADLLSLVAQLPASAQTETEVPAKRKPGRPRKVQAPGQLEPATLAKRPRGRPRKPVLELPGEAAASMPMTAPSELRRKVSPPMSSLESVASAPRREPDVEVVGRELEERRPFRQVEVRKLGPGRGYTRPRGPIQATLRQS